jgi:predicted neuraminidase
MKYLLSILLIAIITVNCNAQTDNINANYVKITSTTSMQDYTNVVSAKDFRKEVKDAGGMVKFVFGKDRPFAQCHASTVEVSKDGTIVVAWFGGSHERGADVGIWSSYYENGKWSYPKEVAKVNETAHWNPVLFRDNNNIVHLFFKVGTDESNWVTYVMQSKDGKTWSKPVELVKGDIGGRGPVKNQPIILSDGTWVAPASVEVTGWKSFVDISHDQGKTWEKSNYFDGRIIENERAKMFQRAGIIKKLTAQDIRTMVDKKEYNKILNSLDIKQAVWSLINARDWKVDSSLAEKKVTDIKKDDMDNYLENCIIAKVKDNNLQSVLANKAEKKKLFSAILMLAGDTLANGPIQPALWESSPGHVHALMRTTAGSIWRADSSDYGKTWGDVYDTGLPNNNSGFDLVKLDSGRLVLVLNPIPENWGPRTPITLMISDDNGLTWKAIANLDDEGAFLGDEEFSYPTIVKTSDNGVIISYTWKRDDVICWKIPGSVLKKY